MEINNRRYIGSKTKLLEFIYKNVKDMGYNSDNIFFDVFAGTGVVANYFADKGYKTIVNDNLYSNKIAYEAFLGEGKYDEAKLKKIINKLNKLDASKLDNNYFSEIYSGKYFSLNDAKKIGYIREYIEGIKDKLSKREYFYILTSLMYATDKIANTVGHFESYLNREPEEKGVELKLLDLNKDMIPADIYNEDANELVKKIESDIAYIDPPYNARQYINFYHVLENLARWNKPTEFEGRSMKFKRNELKSGYCRTKTAKKLFKQLIEDIKCKLIVVSYNNTYDAKSTSSNNTISEEDIIEILKQKGKVTIKEKEYKYFNAGKTDLKGHKELLYICEVK